MPNKRWKPKPSPVNYPKLPRNKVVKFGQMASAMGWNIDFQLPAREEQRLLTERIGFEK